jgi:hypothetical protein
MIDKDRDLQRRSCYSFFLEEASTRTMFSLTRLCNRTRDSRRSTTRFLFRIKSWNNRRLGLYVKAIVPWLYKKFRSRGDSITLTLKRQTTVGRREDRFPIGDKSMLRHGWKAHVGQSTTTLPFPESRRCSGMILGFQPWSWPSKPNRWRLSAGRLRRIMCVGFPAWWAALSVNFRSLYTS